MSPRRSWPRFRPTTPQPRFEDVADPNLIYDLRAKLDGAGHYDEFEVERVVAVQFNPRAKQGDLVAALNPVVDRLVRQFRDAKRRRSDALAIGAKSEAEEARHAIDAPLLFRTDLQSYIHLYTFLLQIFDYGNTALEKRFIFFKYLIPLLEFGRDREGVDLSQVMLTHHTLKNHGAQTIPLKPEGVILLVPISDIGSGSVQEKRQALLAEIIEKVNDPFGAEATEGDKLVYVNGVLKGKLTESLTLIQQAHNNSKEQFAHSPDLDEQINYAIMDTRLAHMAMSKSALDSEEGRRQLKEILLGPGQLWETLRSIQQAV